MQCENVEFGDYSCEVKIKNTQVEVVVSVLLVSEAWITGLESELPMLFILPQKESHRLKSWKKLIIGK